MQSGSGDDARQPKPRTLPPFERRATNESDFHKLMQDFDSLCAEASTGRFSSGILPSHVVVPPPEYLAASRADASDAPQLLQSSSSGVPPDLASGFYGTRNAASPAGVTSLGGSFFRGSNFAPVGGGRAVATPCSRASSSSSATVSDGRLGSCGGGDEPLFGNRLAPLSCALPSSSAGCSSSDGSAPRAHRSLLDLLTSKLRRQPPQESPRPHSVPVELVLTGQFHRTDKGEQLSLLHDDEPAKPVSTRPATTDVTTAASVLQGTRTSGSSKATRPPLPSISAAGSPDSWADHRTAVDKELEEIEKLRAKRESDRQRRELERQQRKLQREAAHSDPPPPGPSAAAAPQPPSIEEEQKRLLDLIALDVELCVETEMAARASIEVQEHQAFQRAAKDASFEQERLRIAEDAAHKLKLRRIAERAEADCRFNAERLKQRAWEFVRDSVFDEEQERTEIEAGEQSEFAAVSCAFVSQMDSPLFAVAVEERLERTERWYVVEHEAYQALQCQCLADEEAVGRRRVQRAYTAMTSQNLTVPILLFHRQCALRILELSRRRQLYTAREIEHGVLWDQFAREVHPLVDRELWKVCCAETNARVLIEQEESDGAATVFHGCESSRELVTRFMHIVREMNARRAQQRSEAIADILEDEIAERILAERDEREARILVQELSRRDVDSIRASVKRRHIEEAMRAAEALRLAEVQELVIEEERQRRMRDATNAQKKQPTSRNATPSETASRSSNTARTRAPPVSLKKVASSKK